MSRSAEAKAMMNMLHPSGLPKRFAQLREVVDRLCVEGEEILSQAKTLASMDTDFSAEGVAKQEEIAEWMVHSYNRWYSQAQILVDRNLPERAREFSELHRGTNSVNDKLSNWDPGANYYLRNSAAGKYFGESIEFAKYLLAEISIIRSIPDAAAVRAMDVKSLLAADLMTDEIAASRHLLESGFLRAAGSIAGVVLERHLRLLCEKKKLKLGKKETVGSLNEKLKAHYEESDSYQKVRWMAEMRALCGHDKSTEPSEQKTKDLVESVYRFISSGA